MFKANYGCDEGVGPVVQLWEAELPPSLCMSTPAALTILIRSHRVLLHSRKMPALLSGEVLGTASAMKPPTLEHRIVPGRDIGISTAPTDEDNVRILCEPGSQKYWGCAFGYAHCVLDRHQVRFSSATHSSFVPSNPADILHSTCCFGRTITSFDLHRHNGPKIVSTYRTLRFSRTAMGSFGLPNYGAQRATKRYYSQRQTTGSRAKRY